VADVAHVIAALGRENEADGLASRDAAWSLTWNAENDPAVLAICEQTSERPGADPILKEVVRVAKAKGSAISVTEESKPTR
jgi:hypothetical protein